MSREQREALSDGEVRTALKRLGISTAGTLPRQGERGARAALDAILDAVGTPGRHSVEVPATGHWGPDRQWVPHNDAHRVRIIVGADGDLRRLSVEAERFDPSTGRSSFKRVPGDPAAVSKEQALAERLAAYRELSPEALAQISPDERREFLGQIVGRFDKRARGDIEDADGNGNADHWDNVYADSTQTSDDYLKRVFEAVVDLTRSPGRKAFQWGPHSIYKLALDIGPEPDLKIGSMFWFTG